MKRKIYSWTHKVQETFIRQSIHFNISFNLGPETITRIDQSVNYVGSNVPNINL